ncbi:hypothetical protein ACEQPO_06300 [Bacillus sp. SL00103]
MQAIEGREVIVFRSRQRYRKEKKSSYIIKQKHTNIKIVSSATIEPTDVDVLKDRGK